MKKKRPVKKEKDAGGKDGFAAVAKRLECDESRERFEKTLQKIAKAPPSKAER